MNKSNKFLMSQSADLTFIELAELGHSIRELLIGAGGLLFPDYIQAAKDLDVKSLGYRRTKALQNEKRLAVYFPDEVFSILREKGKDIYRLTFNNYDDNFIKSHASNGSPWLAKIFYTDKNIIWNRANRIGVKITDSRRYNKSLRNFIIDHVEKGPAWIAREINLPVKGIESYIRRLRNPQEKFPMRKYTHEEEQFVREHIGESVNYMAKALRISTSAARHKMRRIKAAIKMEIHDEQT